MAVRLARVCAEIAADQRVLAVVLTGAGKRAFCAGADLKERNAMSDAELLAQRPVFQAAFGGVLGAGRPGRRGAAHPPVPPPSETEVIP